jgi:hypothetical protein
MTEESVLLKAFRGSKKKKISYRIGYWTFPKTMDFFLKKEMLKITSKLQADESSIIKTSQVSTPKIQKKVYSNLPDELIRYALNSFAQALELKISQSEIKTWKDNVGGEILSLALQGKVSIIHVLGGLLSPSYFSQAIDLTEEGRPKYNQMIEIFKKIKEESLKNKVDLYVIYIPSELHYDINKLELNKKLGYIVKEDWVKSESELEKALKKDMDSLQIPYLSLVESFRNHSSEGLVWKFDLHLNEKGSKLAAENIAEFLIKNLNP